MLSSFYLSDNFAQKLAERIIQNNSSALDIAKIEVILPTKRACRTLKEAFIRLKGDNAFLMPKLTALYEIDPLAEDIPQAISPLERITILSRMCRIKPNIDSLHKALIVVVSLAELLDECYQFEVTLDKLESLVPNTDMATHWQDTVSFLEIIRTVWPQYLKNRSLIDPTDRRIRLINAFTNKIKQEGLDHPVIMAGFDGALPAIARLMAVIKEKGEVILQGFNFTLDNEDLSFIQPQHYHYNFKTLLKKLKMIPAQVENISPLSQIPLREEFLIEAMKPAGQADDWRSYDLQEGVLQNFKRIDCETITEEALAIACILREVLETPEKTATLVTNNRLLARRVILEMKRWDVELDDSAGTPLHHTPCGIFLSLLAEYGVHSDSGSHLLALLKHPLSADKEAPTVLRSKVKEAEKKARHKSLKFSYPLNTDLSPFLTLCKQSEVLFKDILEAHIRVAQELATSNDRTGMERLWSSDAGTSAFQFLSELLSYAETLGTINPESYPQILTFLLSRITVRARYGMHNRLDILGPIEARLSHADVCIISSLNEGSFPQLPQSGPWLNRQMRTALGLPDLENKVAVEEMDFCHCCCAKEVYLTRSMKADGSQTIPSRFLYRIDAVLNACGTKMPIEKPSYALLLNSADKFTPLKRPAPTPPVEARPTTLSATNIELLMCNPYAVYAKHILKLYPLHPLDNIKKSAVYGSSIHKALELYIKKPLSEQTRENLFNDCISKLKENGLNIADIASLKPRIDKTLDFFLSEQEKRADWIENISAEVTGSYTFALEDGSDFTLTAKPDRIDTLKDNACDIIDYKTGDIPKFNAIKSGLSPQLPIEGIILRENGFKDIKPKNDIRLSYWHLTGKNTGGEITPVTLSKKGDMTINDCLDMTKEGIRHVLSEFRKEETPYEASPIPERVKYNDYEHLAREKEWLNADDNNADN